MPPTVHTQRPDLGGEINDNEECGKGDHQELSDLQDRLLQDKSKAPYSDTHQLWTHPCAWSEQDKLGEDRMGGMSGVGRGRGRSRGHWMRHAFLCGSTDPKILNSNQLGSTVGKPYNGIQGIGSMPNCIMGTYKWIKLSLKKVEEKVNWKTLSESGKLQSEFHRKSILSRATSKLALWQGAVFPVLQAIHSLARTWLHHCTKPPQTKHKQKGRLNSKILSTKPGSRLDLLHGLSFIKSWSS